MLKTNKVLRIVLGSGCMAAYPQGGGLWTGFLQHLFGFDALGHSVFWLELMWSSGDPARDRRRVRVFLKRFQRYGFENRCALLLFEDKSEPQHLESAQAFGRSKEEIRQLAQDADLLWNFSCALRQPLLGLFRRRALIDGDPGLVQLSALEWDMGIQDHHTLLTVGTKFRDADCTVPALKASWYPFLPPVSLKHWTFAPDPGPEAPFTSVTQWSWGEFHLDGRVLSTSKRTAYLQYIDLPARARRPMELAANIDPLDETGDREMLLSHGWRLAHPHRVARSPELYRRYIQQSRAELGCPKPIYRLLRTGWFSDRSACYLATGRPVLMEDTGVSDHLPTGKGVVTFRNLEEAAEGIARIDADYETHRQAARGLAHEFLDARKSLQTMLNVCA
jgi:hypothetical protein